MKSSKARIQKVIYRRKREGKTNYKRRLKLLLSKKPRLVIRPTLKSIICQIIDFEHKGDKVLANVDGKELEKYGWKYSKSNLPSAYLAGFLLGKKIKGKIEEAILDVGLKTLTKGSRVFACLKGFSDSGVKINHSEDILPSEDRINGKHIAEYAKKVKEDKQNYEKIFSRYIKNNTDPEKITEVFKQTKEKISSEEK